MIAKSERNLPSLALYFIKLDGYGYSELFLIQFIQYLVQFNKDLRHE